MNIIVSKNSGFCFGVKRAVEKTIQLAEQKNKKIYTYGELIHNSFVIEKLKNLNVEVIETFEELEKIKNDSILIIRAHGIAKDLLKNLKDKNIEIIDLTCVFVSKIQKLVYENYNNGKNIIIIGKKDHPEVIGINGWCNNSALIIDEIPLDYKFNTEKEYFCVVQTTFLEEKYKKIIDFLSNNINMFVFLNTICYTTKERQKEAFILSKKADMMIVIGDKKSSNTKKLYEIVSNNCNNSYFINSKEEAKKIKIKNNIKNLAIIAGASTPKELVMEVKNVMEDIKINPTQQLKKNSSITFEKAIESIQLRNLINDRNKEKVVGKEFKMKIYSIDKTEKKVGLLINVHGKYNFEAIMPFSEILNTEENSDNIDIDNIEDIKEGNSILVKILRIETDNKGKKTDLIASRKAVLEKEENKKILNSILKGNEFTAQITDAVGKNGLLGKCGNLEIFVPASHIELFPVKEAALKKYVGKNLTLVYLNDEVDNEDSTKNKSKRSKNNIKASRKLILEKEQAKINEKFFLEHKIGDIVKGKLVKILAKGKLAFVNVDGKDCLLTITKCAWHRIESIADVLTLNQEYEFLIDQATSEAEGKVFLSYRDLQLKPEEVATIKYPEGIKVKGKVVKIFEKLLFINLEPGIDASLPVSEVAYEYIQNLTERFKEGQELEVLIIKNQQGKITVSLKRLIPQNEEVNEVETESKKFSKKSSDLQDVEVEYDSSKVKINDDKFDLSKVKAQSKKQKVKAKEEIKQENKTFEVLENETLTLGDLFGDLFKNS